MAVQIQADRTDTARENTTTLANCSYASPVMLGMSGQDVLLF